MYQYKIYLFIDDFISKKLPNSFESMFCFNSDIQDHRVTTHNSYMNVSRCNSVLSSKLPLFNVMHMLNNWNRISEKLHVTYIVSIYKM